MNGKKSHFSGARTGNATRSINVAPPETHQFAYGFYLPRRYLPILYKIVYHRDSDKTNPSFLISQIRRKLPDAFPWIKLLEIEGRLFCGGEVPSTNMNTNRRKLGQMKCEYYEIQIKIILDFFAGLTAEQFSTGIERIYPCKS